MFIDMLNASQFNKLASLANVEEGYSVSPSATGHLLALARDKYMVGGITPTKYVDSPMTGGDALAHFSENSEVLQDPRMYMGAWRNDHSGQVELDVSEAYPRTQGGAEEARTATLDRDEIAYGEIDDRRKYVGSHSNPFASRVMGISTEPRQRAEALTPKASRKRGEFFRGGINSEALAILMAGGPGASQQARESWVRTGPPSDQRQ
jgi:hypothetical protein